ncbi:MAG: Asp-tRNA(Asn)/Glu-tRNA(Gln) amidotransferase subunit GatA [Planctomycetes bacterium]|nr:Asp-tRNA(Asn)/Glu-tRNA(Gln) amidotransferase subunit GatA [Planctomycetota bacterium]
MITSSARELRSLVASKKVSAVEITRAYLDRIRAIDPKVKAYLAVTEDAALQAARRVDEKAARGEPLGALAGVPVAIKDNMVTRDAPTTCASKILAGYRAPYEATVVERLRAADALLLGKTNLDEFAMGSSTENSAFGPTRNPWDLQRVPGGSSGGSAAAVAAGMACLALGSDTGGSIRQPASFTATVGFKPTYGRVSRYGLVAFASSLDQIGPFARDVEDAALITRVIAGKDPLDSTSVDLPPPTLKPNGRRFRLGLPREYLGEGLDPEVRDIVLAAAKKLEARGATLVDVSLPTTQYGIAAYYIVAPSEASSNLARYDGVHYGHRTKEPVDLVGLYSKSRREGFGAEVTRRIILGTFALSSGYYEAYYNRALKVRRLLKQDFDRVFERVDAVVGPTSPTPPFRLGERTADPLAMYLSDVYTVSANLAGLPGLSLNCGFTKTGLPVALQIQGKAFDDATVLEIALAVERECGKVTTWPTP